MPPGSIEFELVSDDTEEELKHIRAQIKAVLDAILVEERAEAAKYEQKLARQNALQQVDSHYQTFKQGVWNGALGLVTFAKDTAVKAAEIALYLSPIERMNNLLHATYKSYHSGDFNSAQWKQSLVDNLKDEELKDIAGILGIEVKYLSKEGLQQLKTLFAEAYEITAFIADDPESLDMLTQFGKDYAGAQSSLEWAEFAGGGVFEIVLSALLLMFTGGIGNIAQGASKIRHAGKLRSLGAIFKNLGKLLKRKKLHKKTKVPVDTKKPVKAELPPDKKVSVKPINRMAEHKVCFNPYDKPNYKAMTPAQQDEYIREYGKQLQRQQDAINNMSVDEFKAARDAFKANKRNPLADSMQAETREKYEKDISFSIKKSISKNNPDMSIEEVDAKAAEKTKDIMSKLAALHEPDMVSGGYHTPETQKIGRKDVNSSIGASWNKTDRIGGIDQAVDKAIQNNSHKEKMNVKLKVCRGK
ncbi:MAG TPA: polymorphic toxin type 15 domain-containing protein [Cellvibrio sp.]|nr:polymorphic toxin type 15 domain-containing protein [Cellvibrio sp.]